MPVSRRHVMLQGAVIGAGIISTTIPSMKALAQGQPPLRRTLQGLAWNDPIVETYRDAVALLKAKPASDKTGWAGLATIHGSNPGAYHFCPHGNWYFLPWHRAFTLMYERFIRQLTSNKDFALPFWDWTSNPRMPAVFTAAKLPNNKPNALYVNDTDFGQTWKRTWPATKAMPANIVGHAVLQQILNATDYEEFGTSRPKGQNNTNASWVLKRTGAQGVLEGTAHNNVHNNIGGWMPSASSPRDPIFFMHHCNIDRIWAVWNSLPGNENSPDPLWRGMTFTNNFLNTDGSSWSPKVTDLFDPVSLGYTYGLSTPVAATSPTPSLTALRTRLATMRAAPVPANAEGIKSFTATPPGGAAGTATAPLAVAVNVDPALLASVAKRTPVPSGAELMNFAAAQEQRATGPRVLAFVRDVAVTGAQNTEYQVYLDTPDYSPQDGPSDPSYVGSFGVFVHGEHGGHGDEEADTNANPSFVLDLTGAIQRVYGSGMSPPSALKLRFVPVASKPNAGRPGTIRPGQVEIVFLNT